MKYRIVNVAYMPDAPVPDYGQMLRQSGFDVEYIKTTCTTESEIIAACAQADAVIGAATYQRFSREVIESLARCRLIVSIGIGYDNLDVKAATEFGVLTANIPDYCLEEMSDHAMALILASTRKLTTLNSMVKREGWTTDPEPNAMRHVWPAMTHLRGQTLGLVGLGRIAQALLSKAKGFGMRLIACDPYVDGSAMTRLGVEKVDLDRLLEESDVISLHAPLTPQTAGMFGPREFARMKPTALLINTARGGLIDHAALYQALVEGKLAGAAIDVVDTLPIMPNDPLLMMENVIVTPHSAHASVSSMMTLLNRPGEEIARVLRGEWPIGLLNPAAKKKYREKWG